MGLGASPRPLACIARLVWGGGVGAQGAKIGVDVEIVVSENIEITFE